MASILYICQNALGDVITTLPSIHFLARHLDDQIDVCINESFADIFAADPHVDRVIPAPAAWFDTQWPENADAGVRQLPLFRKHYDVIIDSMCVSQTMRLIELLRPSQATGIGFDETLHVYDLPVPLETWKSWSDNSRTVCDCFADVVRAYREDYQNTAPILHVGDNARRWAETWLSRHNPDQKPLVALNPGAGSPLKYWPAARYLDVARELTARGYLPLFTFGPKEIQLLKSLTEPIGETGGVIYESPNSNIQQVSALLQRCLLTVTNDCAVMHVSASVGTRTLAIFGLSISKIWFPYAKPWNQVVERDVSCRSGCLLGCPERHCIDSITSTEVLERIWPMLPRQ